MINQTVEVNMTEDTSHKPKIEATELRDLSKANAHKGKLMMRRISLLIETGEASAMELLDKLMKVKLSKAQA
ncbi:hypothetical protein JZU69_06410 [bacterium]|nr:hypothetical protein [bacterium]